MPKRKRKEREKRYEPPLSGPPAYEDDSNDSEVDGDELQEGLLEGRFEFLAKLTP